jgi:hypothetical protein
MLYICNSSLVVELENYNRREMFNTRRFHSIYSNYFVLQHAQYISRMTFLCIQGVWKLVWKYDDTDVGKWFVRLLYEVMFFKCMCVNLYVINWWILITINLIWQSGNTILLITILFWRTALYWWIWGSACCCFCWFLAWCTLWLRRWKWYVSPKREVLSKLHSVTTQKTIFFWSTL